MNLVAPSAIVTAGKNIAALMGRFGGRCRYCRVAVTKESIKIEEHRLATREHLIPKARGGGDTEQNIGLSCKACNHSKGDMTDVEFEHLIETGELHPAYSKWIADSVLKTLLHRLKTREKTSG